MLSFRSLKNAGARRGYEIEQQVFDCGDTVRVSQHGKLLLVTTRECGDSDTASEATAGIMLERGMLVVQDFDVRIGAQ